MSFNKFAIIKNAVDIVEVARYYGINLNAHNRCRCIFHNDKSGDLSVSESKQIYKCFSCDAAGDVFGLVNHLFGLSSLESAKKINLDFNCGVDFGAKTPVAVINEYKKQKDLEQANRDRDEAYEEALCKKFKMYREWLKEEIYSGRHCEALLNIHYIEFLLDESLKKAR